MGCVCAWQCGGVLTVTALADTMELIWDTNKSQASSQRSTAASTRGRRT